MDFRGVVSRPRVEIFQQSKEQVVQIARAGGKGQERDTVTTKKNKMGAACKTSVALRAGAGQGQGQDGVLKAMGQESSDVDV